ncbi:MAG: hypothetical protein WBG65_08860 [Sulfurimonadaceae bacterium]
MTKLYHTRAVNKIDSLFLGIVLFATASLQAEDVTINKGLYRATYETLSLPGNEDMGFLGINYLLTNEMGFYYGLGVYGSITGERGGFFTGGLELGYQHNLFKTILLDVGLFGGGGGGGAAPQGGGLMLRPHAGLLYDASSWRLGLAYSKVKFPNGEIDSDQISLQLEMPFETVSAETKDSKGLDKALRSYSHQYDFGWIDHYFAATFERYFPLSGTKDTSGEEDLESISLIGFEYGSYLNKRWFGFLEAAGAMNGGAGGYGEVLGGLGYDYAFNQKLGVKAKVSLGSAGGGRVDTGGGFVYKAYIGAYYKPIKELTINAETGYMDAPDGSFSAQIVKLNLAYSLTFLGIGRNIRDVDTYKDATTGEWNIRIVNQTYLPSDTIRYNKEDNAVQLIGLKIDRYINNHFYVTGQAYGAYSGDVGGYASGLVGLGYRTPRFFETMSLYFELLGGAGAGGGVASEGGAIIQPMTGINYGITKRVDVQVGIGQIRSLKGTLNTTVADIGLVYKFGTIEKR